MSKQLTIKQFHTILGELIADGYGDKEFQLWYDSENTYTTIPLGSRIILYKNAVRFTDYDDGECHLTDELMEMLK